MKAKWKFRAVRYVNAAGYASGFWIGRHSQADLVGNDSEALAFAARAQQHFSAKKQTLVRVEARTTGDVDFSVPDVVRPRYVYRVTPRPNSREWRLSAGMTTGWFPNRELAIEGAASLARDTVAEIRVDGERGFEFVVLIDTRMRKQTSEAANLLLSRGAEVR